MKLLFLCKEDSFAALENLIVQNSYFDSSVIFSFMPHESFLGQDELRDFCIKHKSNANIIIENISYNDLNCINFKSDIDRDNFINKYSKKYELSKYLFSSQYFNSEFFDRDYMRPINSSVKYQIWANYLIYIENLFNKYDFDYIINYEELTELGRAATFCVADKYTIPFITIRYSEILNRAFFLQGYNSLAAINFKSIDTSPLNNEIKAKNNAHKFKFIHSIAREFSEIKNYSKLIIRNNFGFINFPDNFIGKPKYRIRKHLIYLLRDFFRKIIYIKRSKVIKIIDSQNYYIFSAQTFPESSTVVEGFPHLSLYGTLFNLRTRLPIEANLLVKLHPNSDYEISLRQEKLINSIPNVYIVRSVESSKVSLDLAKNSLGVITESNGSIVIEAILEKIHILFLNKGWVIQLLENVNPNIITIDESSGLYTINYDYYSSISLIFKSYSIFCGSGGNSFGDELCSIFLTRLYENK